MYAIETINLTKKFGDRTALDNLNIKIETGKVFSLLGQNGAGKTTTIKLLSCLAAPTAGDALIMGHRITENTGEIKKIINICPQETAVAPNLTVRENLEFIAGIYGADKAKSKKDALLYMEMLGISDRAGDRSKKLSGGLCRRLSIAMGLISRPKLLFLDEPTLGLDVRARRELWNIIRNIKSETNIVLTTIILKKPRH